MFDFLFQFYKFIKAKCLHFLAIDEKQNFSKNLAIAFACQCCSNAKLVSVDKIFKIKSSKLSNATKRTWFAQFESKSGFSQNKVLPISQVKSRRVVEKIMLVI